MSRKRALQASEARVIEPARALDSADQSSEFSGPWLRADSAARFLDFHGKEPVEAFRVWARRRGIATAHIGTRVLYAKADLLRAIGATVRRSA